MYISRTIVIQRKFNFSDKHLISILLQKHPCVFDWTCVVRWWYIHHATNQINVLQLEKMHMCMIPLYYRIIAKYLLAVNVMKWKKQRTNCETMHTIRLIKNKLHQLVQTTFLLHEQLSNTIFHLSLLKYYLNIYGYINTLFPSLSTAFISVLLSLISILAF